MGTPLLITTLLLLAASAAAHVGAEEIVVEPAAPTSGPTTVYRQIMPDGRVVYSDDPTKGVKVDRTLEIAPPIKGNAWTTETGPRPNIPEQSTRTRVNKVTSVPGTSKRKALEAAETEVIRREMLLEDAKKRQEAGVEPLPGERTGTVGGGSRLNQEYDARQQALARAVANAEAALDKAQADFNALR